MSDNDTTRVLQFSDGRLFQEMPDGSLQPMARSHDWARFDAMTDDEVEANALSDPDNPPWTEADLARLKPLPQAKRIRRQLRLTQEQFADRFHLPLGTLRDWELGRREPDTAAKNFLRVIEHNPEAVIAALEG
ncbi:MAG: helix-turn-helix domain-containing protein [Thermomicrobiales bacterium]